MKNFTLNPFVKLYLAWLVFVFFSTELFSYLTIISRPSIVAANLIFFSTYVFSQRQELFASILSLRTLEFIKSKSNLLILLILSLIFIQGFFSAPNTTDSMTYHITRVMYWIQDQTVYQNLIRSSHDFMPPFGEYIFLHLYLLAGGDRLLSYSSWLAFAVSIYLSGAIAFKMETPEKVIKLTRLFVVAIPIAVMQASSTQVDLITNVLALFGLYFTLNLIERANIKDSLILAIITGMGVMVKAPFVFHIFIPLGLLALLKLPHLKKEIYIFLIILLVSLLMQRHYLHNNFNLYGNFFGLDLAGQQNRYVNDRFDLPALTSNVIRNSFNQFPVPIFASVTEDSLARFLNLIGTDIQDPLTTYPGHEFHVQPVVYPQEDIVSSPVHLVLIILGAIFLYKSRKQVKNFKIVSLVLILTIASYTLFAYVLKYEPYHPRLQIPHLAFGTIGSVTILSSYKWGTKLLNILLMPAIILAFALIFLNVLRPYISYSSFYDLVKAYSPPTAAVPEAFYEKPRLMQYFNARPYLYAPYNNVADLVASKPGDKHIVLNLFHDEFEYPLWALLKSKNVNFRIQQNKFVKSPIPENALILSTLEEPVNIDGYNTQCYKTEIEYGYVCLSTPISR